MIWSGQSKSQVVNTLSPPLPPQIAPAAETTYYNGDTTDCPPPRPQDLDVIKEFLQHEKDDNYIPLMSPIALRKKTNAFFTHRNQQR